MTLPNFLIIGAAKSGTTAIVHYMQQHPEVYIAPVKECSYFAVMNQEVRFQGPGDDDLNSRLIFDFEDYRRLFAAAGDAPAVGEASVWYLQAPEAARRIQACLPQVKLVAVLRNPIERAYSCYLMMRRAGRETCATFEKALQMEEERIAAGWEWVWHYRSGGFYHRQLNRYFETFDRSRIRVYLYDDFKSRPLDVLKDIFQFLGVEPSFSPDMTYRPNISGVPRNGFVYGLLTREGPVKNIARRLVGRRLRRRMRTKFDSKMLDRPEISGETRRSLRGAFVKDVKDLGKLLSRDLSAWLD